MDLSCILSTKGSGQSLNPEGEDLGYVFFSPFTAKEKGFLM